MLHDYPNLEKLSNALTEERRIAASCAEYTGQDADFWHYKVTGVTCCIWILIWENGSPVAGMQFNFKQGDTFSVAKKDQTWMPCKMIV